MKTVENQFDNHLLVEMNFHMDEFFNMYSSTFFPLYLCTTIEKTIHNTFYKIKFLFLCTPICMICFLLTFFSFCCVRVFWRQMIFCTLLTCSGYVAYTYQSRVKVHVTFTYYKLNTLVY